MNAIPNIGRVGVWYGLIDALPAGQAIEAAQHIESLGYGALWVAEAVGRDPMVTSTLCLSGTESLVLATGIANIYARDPMTMVSAQMAIAEAFPQRFLLGLGVSHGHLVAGIRRHDWSKPLAYMAAYLDRMDEAIYFAPRPQIQPPRVLAALRPRMLELAGTRAAGAHPYFTVPEHTADARSVLGPDPLLAPEQMVVLERDPAKARAIARAGMAIYLNLPNYQNNLRRFGFGDDDFADGGSDRLVDAVVVWGDEEAVVRRVTEHHDAGADHVCIQILDDSPAMPLQQWERLAPALLGEQDSEVN